MRKFIIAGLAMLTTLGAVLAAVLGSSAGPVKASTTATVDAATGTRVSTAAAANASTLMLQLNGVSCVSATFCAGVGAEGNSAHPARGNVPLTMIWNGARWRETATPLPKGWPEGQLGGVSCTSTSYCVAVGDYSTGSGSTVNAMVDTWNGRDWTATVLPRPAGTLRIFDGAISCPAAHRCVADDIFSATTSEGHGFAETLTGTKWTLRDVPLPKGSAGGGVGGVSCVSVTDCVLSGGSYTAALHQTVLFESWNGKTFARMKAASPAGPQLSGVGGVSCTSAESCVAVGSGSQPGDYNQTGFAELWNGKNWSVTSVTGPENPLLVGVSCAAAKTCVAVGYTSTNGSEETSHALAVSYDGHWATGSVPPLANGGASAFTSVSCVSTTDCVAVGEGGGPGKTLFSSAALTAFWNGKSWKLVGAS
jgi:hypothetical protein